MDPEVARAARSLADHALLLLGIGIGLVAVVVVAIVAAVRVARRLHDSASPGWQQLFQIITRFGSGKVLGVVSAIIAAALLVRREYVLAIGWIFAQAGGGVLNVTLKRAFERSRPESWDAQLASGWSFPSGHAMTTFVFCGLAAYLLLRIARSTSMRVVVVVGASTWCLTIGFTRLYLGVHYASDVAAGVIAAAAWVAVCVSAIELGLRRRVISSVRG
jgi:membrane-associated phospholipid phosphatase